MYIIYLFNKNSITGQDVKGLVKYTVYKVVKTDYYLICEIEDTTDNEPSIIDK